MKLRKEEVQELVDELKLKPQKELKKCLRPELCHLLALAAEEDVKAGRTSVPQKDIDNQKQKEDRHEKRQEAAEIIELLDETIEADKQSGSSKKTTQPKELTLIELPQRVYQYETMQGIEILKGTLIPNTYKFSNLKAKYHKDQCFVVCKPCCHVWQPLVQKCEITDHCNRQCHVRSIEELRKSASQRTLSEMCATTGSSALDRKLCDAVLFSGVTYAQFDIILTVLKGVMLPTNPGRTSDIVQRQISGKTKEAEEFITEKITKGRFSVFHDGGHLMGRAVNGLVVQKQVNGQHLSAVLKPLILESGSFTANMLCKLVPSQLPPRVTPWLVRSDRGGCDGGASRELARLWSAIFLACLAHILNNIAEEFEESCGEHLAVELLRCIRQAFFANSHNEETRAHRWVVFQKSPKAAINKTALQKAMMQIKEEGQHLSSGEESLLVEDWLSILNKDCFAKAMPPNLNDCKTVADLLPQLQSIVEQKENDSRENTKPERFNSGSDTKYSHRFEGYTHILNRIALFKAFVADEMRKSANPCTSLRKLTTLLGTNSQGTLETELQAFIEVVTPVQKLLVKFTDLQSGPFAHTVFAEMEGALAGLKNVEGDLATRMHAIFEKRWQHNSESGRLFWQVARHMDPRQLRSMKRAKTALSWNEICAIIPQFTEIGEAAWEDYENETISIGTDVREFWLSYKNRELASLALDVCYTSPAATHVDSLLSVANALFPPERRCFGVETTKELLFHKCNGDLLSRYPKSKHIRKGFPRFSVVENEDIITEDGGWVPADVDVTLRELAAKFGDNAV